MTETSHVYVHYPGHLGPHPVTELTSQRGILWDAPVKLVPAIFAESLISEGGFELALDLDAAKKALGFPKTRLRELIADGRLRAATYTKKGEDVELIVIPSGLTPAALAAQINAQEEMNDAA